MSELRAFLFGLSVAGAIGPIAVLIVRNGLNYGLRMALRSGLGAGAADFLYSVLALGIGARLTVILVAHEHAIRMTTATILIVIGIWLALKSLRSRRNATPNLRVTISGPCGFWMTFLLTLANPLTLVIFMGFSGQLSLSGDKDAVLYYSSFVFLGSLLVQMVLGFFGASLRKWITDLRTITVLNFLSATAIIAFGVNGLLAVS